MAAQSGGCLCGALRYEVSSPPLRVTLCHCRFCQRATGSSHLVEPLFNRTDVHVTRGQQAVYTHRSEGSGKGVDLHFCVTCGTKIYMTFERFPDLCGIYAGTLDDPTIVEVRADNAKQVFVASARPDAVLLPGINTFSGAATAADGTAHPPEIYRKPRVVGHAKE